MHSIGEAFAMGFTSGFSSDNTRSLVDKGDFNVIVCEKEKLRGLPVTVAVTVAETEDFKHCINLCGIEDLGFKGSIYT